MAVAIPGPTAASRTAHAGKSTENEDILVDDQGLNIGSHRAKASAGSLHNLGFCLSRRCPHRESIVRTWLMRELEGRLNMNWSFRVETLCHARQEDPTWPRKALLGSAKPRLHSRSVAAPRLTSPEALSKQLSLGRDGLIHQTLWLIHIG